MKSIQLCRKADYNKFSKEHLSIYSLFFRPHFLQQKSGEDKKNGDLFPPLITQDGERYIRLVGEGWRRATSDSLNVATGNQNQANSTSSATDLGSRAVSWVKVIAMLVVASISGHSYL